MRCTSRVTTTRAAELFKFAEKNLQFPSLSKNESRIPGSTSYFCCGVMLGRSMLVVVDNVWNPVVAKRLAPQTWLPTGSVVLAAFRDAKIVNRYWFHGVNFLGVESGGKSLTTGDVVPCRRPGSINKGSGCSHETTQTKHVGLSSLSLFPGYRGWCAIPDRVRVVGRRCVKKLRKERPRFFFFFFFFFLDWGMDRIG